MCVCVCFQSCISTSTHYEETVKSSIVALEDNLAGCPVSDHWATDKSAIGFLPHQTIFYIGHWKFTIGRPLVYYFSYKLSGDYDSETNRCWGRQSTKPLCVQTDTNKITKVQRQHSLVLTWHICQHYLLKNSDPEAPTLRTGAFFSVVPILSHYGTHYQYIVTLKEPIFYSHSEKEGTQ